VETESGGVEGGERRAAGSEHRAQSGDCGVGSCLSGGKGGSVGGNNRAVRKRPKFNCADAMQLRTVFFFFLKPHRCTRLAEFESLETRAETVDG
jgi:hypothetical protein